jgi:hypothetical protein
MFQFCCWVFVVKSRDFSKISRFHEILAVIVPVPLKY